MSRGLALVTGGARRIGRHLCLAAARAGYEIALHVVMVPEELSVVRVRYRVEAGGHDVPEDKIRGRHQRLWGLVAQAVPLVDTAHFWDNSHHDGPELVARMVGGHSVGAVSWPAWASPDLTRRWPSG